MKSQELTVSCHYSKGEDSILRIIQSSFDAFLRKELQGLPNEDGLPGQAGDIHARIAADSFCGKPLNLLVRK